MIFYIISYIQIIVLFYNLPRKSSFSEVEAASL